MRIVIQRCKEASVTVNGKPHASIQEGMMLLVCFTEGDCEKDLDYMAKKVANLRIFDDEQGIMNESILVSKGSILSISQFTLYAQTRKGNRPSYMKALNGDLATHLYDLFNQKLEKFGIMVKTGVFGSDMQVSLVNDGPVTILIDSKEDVL